MITTNNTSVDFLTEYEMQNLKHANLCKIKQVIQQLYSKQTSIINSINTLIGLDDGTLDVIDNISEAIAETRSLKEWRESLRKITISHINHGGTAVGDNNPTFKATTDGVTFNYDCFNLSNGVMTSHDNTAFPVASTVQAGIVTAGDYKNIQKAGTICTYSHVHHDKDDTGWSGEAFTSDKDEVTMHFACYDPDSKTPTTPIEKTTKLPVASSSNAGVVTADMFNKIDDIAKKVDVVITPYITTITINQKGEISDPDSMITGDIANGKDPKENAVAWIRANSHKYVSQGYDKDTLILRQLDDSDTTKYADGTDASSDITKQDVFMKLPEFWYKGEELEEDLWKISFTYKEELVDDTWLHWEGDTCIGVYEGCVDNNSLHSYSGSIPIVNKNFNEFKDLAKNNNSQLITYEAHKIMSLLFYAYYGTTNSQGVCGSGTTTYPKTTGLTNSLGMNDTVNENKSSIQYWGLENWWGDISEFVDDLVTENTTGLVNLLDVNGNVVRTMQAGVVGNTIQPIAAKYIFGDNLDLIVKAHDSSELKYYTCVGYLAPYAGFVAARSYYGAYSSGGVAYLGVGYSASYSLDFLGSRLCHKGKYLIQ